MNRLVLTGLLAVLLTCLTPSVSQVHAAGLQDVLTLPAVQQYMTVDNLGHLVQLKKDYDQGNRAGMTATLIKVASQDPRLNNLVGFAQSGNINSVVEEAVRQQIETKINAMLTPYEKEVTTATTILNVLRPQQAAASSIASD